MTEPRTKGPAGLPGYHGIFPPPTHFSFRSKASRKPTMNAVLAPINDEARQKKARDLLFSASNFTTLSVPPAKIRKGALKSSGTTLTTKEHEYTAAPSPHPSTTLDSVNPLRDAINSNYVGKSHLRAVLPQPKIPPGYLESLHSMDEHLHQLQIKQAAAEYIRTDVGEKGRSVPLTIHTSSETKEELLLDTFPFPSSNQLLAFTTPTNHAKYELEAQFLVEATAPTESSQPSDEEELDVSSEELPKSRDSILAHSVHAFENTPTVGITHGMKSNRGTSPGRTSGMMARTGPTPEKPSLQSWKSHLDDSSDTKNLEYMLEVWQKSEGIVIEHVVELQRQERRRQASEAHIRLSRSSSRQGSVVAGMIRSASRNNSFSGQEKRTLIVGDDISSNKEAGPSGNENWHVEPTITEEGNEDDEESNSDDEPGYEPPQKGHGARSIASEIPLISVFQDGIQRRRSTSLHPENHAQDRQLLAVDNKPGAASIPATRRLSLASKEIPEGEEEKGTSVFPTEFTDISANITIDFAEGDGKKMSNSRTNPAPTLMAIQRANFDDGQREVDEDGVLILRLSKSTVMYLKKLAFQLNNSVKEEDGLFSVKRHHITSERVISNLLVGIDTVSRNGSQFNIHHHEEFAKQNSFRIRLSLGRKLRRRAQRYTDGPWNEFAGVRLNANGEVLVRPIPYAFLNRGFHFIAPKAEDVDGRGNDDVMSDIDDASSHRNITPLKNSRLVDDQMSLDDEAKDTLAAMFHSQTAFMKAAGQEDEGYSDEEDLESALAKHREHKMSKHEIMVLGNAAKVLGMENEIFSKGGLKRVFHYLKSKNRTKIEYDPVQSFNMTRYVAHVIKALKDHPDIQNASDPVAGMPNLPNLAAFLISPVAGLKQLPEKKTPEYHIFLKALLLSIQMPDSELKFDACRTLIILDEWRSLNRWDSIAFRETVHSMLKFSTHENRTLAAMALCQLGVVNQTTVKEVLKIIFDIIYIHRKAQAIQVIANIDRKYAETVMKELLHDAKNISWKTRIEIVHLLEIWVQNLTIAFPQRSPPIRTDGIAEQHDRHAKEDIFPGELIPILEPEEYLKITGNRTGDAGAQSSAPLQGPGIMSSRSPTIKNGLGVLNSVSKWKRYKTTSDEAREREQELLKTQQKMLNEGIAALIDRMWNDWSPEVRDAAAKALANLKESNAIMVHMTKMLVSTDDLRRKEALKSFGSLKIMPSMSVAPFLECFKDPVYANRIEACKVACTLRSYNRGIIRALLDALGDDQWEVRAFAVKALGLSKCTYPKNIEALICTLSYEIHPAVRIEAILACESLNLIKEDEGVRNAALTLKETDPSPKVRVQAEKSCIAQGVISIKTGMDVLAGKHAEIIPFPQILADRSVSERDVFLRDSLVKEQEGDQVVESIKKFTTKARIIELMMTRGETYDKVGAEFDLEFADFQPCLRGIHAKPKRKLSTQLKTPLDRRVFL